MEAFGPHASSAFEGYYSKFDLPSGAHLALIISSVRNGTTRPHMVSVTYVTKHGESYWQREYWPDRINFEKQNDSSFVMNISGMGSVHCSAKQETYALQANDFELHAETDGASRQPWHQGDAESTPAGFLARAPLPLHWHVHTLSSNTKFRLRYDAQQAEPSLHELDHAGDCTVHHEKNWAVSFPSKYIWIQAWDADRKRGLCIAGGELFAGLEAYLLTYTQRSGASAKSLTFSPPWTIGLGRLSPFCRTRHSYADGRVDLDVCSLRHRITIQSTAPKDTFFQLSAPLPEGHRPRFAAQSFAATHNITTYTRSWPWQSWSLVERDILPHGSLEFGGGYYDEAGDKSQ